MTIDYIQLQRKEFLQCVQCALPMWVVVAPHGRVVCTRTCLEKYSNRQVLLGGAEIVLSGDLRDCRAFWHTARGGWRRTDVVVASSYSIVGERVRRLVCGHQENGRAPSLPLGPLDFDVLSLLWRGSVQYVATRAEVERASRYHPGPPDHWTLRFDPRFHDTWRVR